MSDEQTNDRYLQRIEAGFLELKTILRSQDDRLRALETREAGCAPIMTSRVDAAWRKVDSHEVELKALREDLSALTHAVDQLQSILKWVLGVATAIIISLLVAIATGRLSISVTP